MADIERLVSRYHDPRPDSLRRVVMAPTTVLHSAPGAQLREMAKLARSWGSGCTAIYRKPSIILTPRGRNSP